MKEIFESYGIPESTLDLLSPDATSSLFVPEDEIQTSEVFASTLDQSMARAEWHATCLRQSGFPAEVGTDASIRISRPGIISSLEATEADEICAVEAQIRFPFPPPPRTREDYERLYEFILELASCLEHEEFEVEEPPTFAMFYELGGEWSPYGSVPFLSRDEWMRLNEKCPQQ